MPAATAGSSVVCNDLAIAAATISFTSAEFITPSRERQWMIVLSISGYDTGRSMCFFRELHNSIVCFVEEE